MNQHVHSHFNTLHVRIPTIRTLPRVNIASECSRKRSWQQANTEGRELDSPGLLLTTKMSSGQQQKKSRNQPGSTNRTQSQARTRNDSFNEEFSPNRSQSHGRWRRGNVEQSAAGLEFFDNLRNDVRVDPASYPSSTPYGASGGIPAPAPAVQREVLSLRHELEEMRAMVQRLTARDGDGRTEALAQGMADQRRASQDESTLVAATDRVNERVSQAVKDLSGVVTELRKKPRSEAPQPEKFTGGYGVDAGAFIEEFRQWINSRGSTEREAVTALRRAVSPEIARMLDTLEEHKKHVLEENYLLILERFSEEKAKYAHQKMFHERKMEPKEDFDDFMYSLVDHRLKGWTEEKPDWQSKKYVIEAIVRKFISGIPDLAVREHLVRAQKRPYQEWTVAEAIREAHLGKSVANDMDTLVYKPKRAATEPPGNRPHNQGGDRPRQNTAQPFDGNCHHCGQRGHMAKDCRNPPKRVYTVGGSDAEGEGSTDPSSEVERSGTPFCRIQ